MSTKPDNRNQAMNPRNREILVFWHLLLVLEDDVGKKSRALVLRNLRNIRIVCHRTSDLRATLQIGGRFSGEILASGIQSILRQVVDGAHPAPRTTSGSDVAASTVKIKVDCPRLHWQSLYTNSLMASRSTSDVLL